MDGSSKELPGPETNQLEPTLPGRGGMLWLGSFITQKLLAHEIVGVRF